MSKSLPMKQICTECGREKTPTNADDWCPKHVQGDTEGYHRFRASVDVTAAIAQAVATEREKAAAYLDALYFEDEEGFGNGLNNLARQIREGRHA